MEHTAPASYAQRAMWAIAQRHRNAPLNVMILPWRVEGKLDTVALSDAVSELLVRHSALRTRLDVVDGQLLQVIQCPRPVHLEVTPVSGASDCARRQAASEILKEKGRIARDLRSKQTIDFELLRVTSTEHLFCLFMHHALCDGWSSQIIQHEIAELYAAKVSDRAPSLVAEPRQFSEFADEQISRYESGLYEQDLTYWRRELATLPPRLNLTNQNTQHGIRDMSAESPTRLESATFASDIRGIAKRNHVSPFAVLLSALAILLHSRSGATDLLVGVSTLNRWSKELFQVVGLVSNFLPARIRLRPDQNSAELFVNVHDTIRRLLVYGRVPFELIVRDLYGPIAATPAMQVWCQHRQLAHPTELADVRLRFTPMLIDRAAILCELEVDLIESALGLNSMFAHRKALFSAEFIAKLMGEFSAIAHRLVRHPDLPIAQILSE